MVRVGVIMMDGITVDEEEAIELGAAKNGKP
jgi:hypothetical protein